jgi:hypothetical protein
MHRHGACPASVGKGTEDEGFPQDRPAARWLS